MIIDPRPRPPGAAPGRDDPAHGQPARPATATAAAPSLNYQSGLNTERPAINSGNVTERAAKEGRLAQVTAGAAKDFLKGTQSEDAANLRRGISQLNAQQNMVEQANRSELFQAGLAQQVDMFSKMAQHRASQAGMAAEIMQKLMQSREALMQSLMQ